MIKHYQLPQTNASLKASSIKNDHHHHHHYYHMAIKGFNQSND